MNLRPLVISDAARADIARVVKYAQAHPFNYEMMSLRAAGELFVPGDHPEFVCVIPVGYRCVYTHEEGEHKVTGEKMWLQHLSISVMDPRRPRNAEKVYPNEEAAVAISEEFGFEDFRKNPGVVSVYTDEFDERSNAVNILAPLAH